MTRFAIPFLLFCLIACGSTEGPAVENLAAIQDQAIATAYTTRLPADDPETQAIVISQTVYAATHEENSVGAIILARQNLAEAFTAMQRITHMPVNAPLLYLNEDDRISPATLHEMRRLNPDGVPFDDRVQVYVIGAVPSDVETTIERELGYNIRRFSAEDPIELAELLDRWQAALKADHEDEVVITALDEQSIAHGMGAMGWNAHMGKGFAWVYRHRIPEATHKILRRRFGTHEAFIYLTGGPELISDTVARELSQYGLVRRVYGSNVYESNVVNAGYKDFGGDFGWWWGWEARSFGWGISQSGHNFIIASADNLLASIPAAVLGHMGKHGPILLVTPDQVPKSVVNYLDMVRPTMTGPTETILNHAWIIGNLGRISWPVQKQISELLQPVGLSPSKDIRRGG